MPLRSFTTHIMRTTAIALPLLGAPLTVKMVDHGLQIVPAQAWAEDDHGGDHGGGNDGGGDHGSGGSDRQQQRSAAAIMAAAAAAAIRAAAIRAAAGATTTAATAAAMTTTAAAATAAMMAARISRRTRMGWSRSGTRGSAYPSEARAALRRSPVAPSQCRRIRSVS